jgi:hypothetical protein
VIESKKESIDNRRQTILLLMELRELEKTIYSQYEKEEGLANIIINSFLDEPLLESSDTTTLREVFEKQGLLEGKEEGKPWFKHILDKEAEPFIFDQKKSNSKNNIDAVKQEAVEEVGGPEQNEGGEDRGRLSSMERNWENAIREFLLAETEGVPPPFSTNSAPPGGEEKRKSLGR